ncbi:hypothetical protein X750_03435 [Mesorhizobium sp. LNJC394B00]|nr:hypothetical protein X750_03435 [Mesorhizobium sp. LNJC394B00]
MRAGIFLSLRRGERWRREAATEWGKALMKPTVAAKQERRKRARNACKQAISG